MTQREPSGVEQALDLLRTELGASAFRTERNAGGTRLYVERERLTIILRLLRDRTGFRFLSELGCSDYLGYPGREVSRDRYEVHYILLDHDRAERLVVKAGVPENDTALPSVTGLWAGADWMEREVYDMYGIRFDGHPDLRRILMPDEFTAYPLRKDYPLRGRGERHNFERMARERS